MKRLAVSIAIVLFLAGVFIFGVLTTTSAAMISAFCLWSPAVGFLGYSVARAGVRITIQGEESPIPRTNTAVNGHIQRRTRRLEDAS